MAIKKLVFLLILSFAFTTANSQIQFAPAQTFTTGSSADIVCVGDLNNDGLSDVALGTGFYFDAVNDYKVFVYLQNSSGSLELPVKYSYPNAYPGLKSLKIADLNHDGRNDIAIAYDGRIGIFYQNEAATFDPVQEIQTNLLILSLDTGDLNSDGLQDLVISTEYAASFAIYYQTVQGTLTPVSYPKATNTKYTEVEVGDVNSDGKDDIVFNKEYLTSGIHVYIQNDSGFHSYAEYNVPEIDTFFITLNGIAIGDLNHDGKVDIAASRSGNRPRSKIIVWYQNDANLLDAPVIVAAYDIPEPVEIDDFNNDGDNELITVNGGWQRVSCYQQTENHTLDQYTLYPIPYATSYEPQGLSLGDLNDDGAKDIAIADYNHGLIILYNTSVLAASTFDSNESNIIVYPNPVDTFINIEIKSDASDLELKLYDALGQCVMMGNHLMQHENNIDLSHLKSGIYFLKLMGENKTFTQKIIKI